MQRCLVICGPTASGKSDLTDAVVDLVRERDLGSRTVLVDSMQVYREIPHLTNQHRRHPARLSGMVSVTEEWSVAQHKDAAYGELDLARERDEAVILEAGTGMYLNAILLDVPMFARVSPETRRLAERNVRRLCGEPNVRRAVRREELRLAGEPGTGEGGSIWSGEPPFEVAYVYLRPDRERADAAIAARSAKLCREGLSEARSLLFEPYAGRTVATVSGAIGVRELTAVVSGELSLDEAEVRVATRTRQLARRQVRWFDKLTRVLEEKPGVEHLHVFETAPGQGIRDTLLQLHDTIEWWIE